MNEQEIMEKYGKSEHGNFRCIDKIGVPHPFMITPKHIVHASDNYSGMLGEDAIRNLEKKLGRPTCGVRNCNLYFDKHEQVLLVECKKEANGSEELHQYLNRIVKEVEKDGFVGFTFLKGWKDEPIESRV